MLNNRSRQISFPRIGHSTRRARKSGCLAAAACLGLVGFGSHAQADVLAAGALFGGTGQTEAVCYVYNAGRTSVRLKGFKITDLDGAKLPITTGECTTSPFTLAAGKACGIAVSATSGAMNCRVVVTPSKVDVRGVFEVRASGGVVLHNTPMR